jgi:hypothetical protein
MKKTNIFIWVGIVLVVGIAAWWFFLREAGADTTSVIISPKVGTFTITVTTTGELQAKNSLEIRGPEGVRQQGIWQMKISKLVPEGTTVKPGDMVAELDQSEIAAKTREAQLNIQKSQAEYTKTKLDTALTLAAAREELSNLAALLEEKKLIKEQSIYEAPAVQKQVDLDYKRTERQLKEATSNYKTKVQQAVAKMQSVEADLTREQQKFQMLSEMIAQFRIIAPAAGIVVYQREWNGKKRVVGSTVSPWDPTVATLPDLDTMESITYVNEVDIQKIQKGQTVKIGLDSDPNKKLSGIVTSVANIGEQRPNSDSKVFEVRIIINERDTSLRPAMTTDNTILVSSIEQKMYLPLEALHPDSGRTFIFKQDGSSVIKQEVKIGVTNENEATIEAGLAKTDKVYLSLPQEALIRKATVKLLPPQKDSSAVKPKAS